MATVLRRWPIRSHKSILHYCDITCAPQYCSIILQKSIKKICELHIFKFCSQLIPHDWQIFWGGQQLIEGNAVIFNYHLHKIILPQHQQLLQPPPLSQEIYQNFVKQRNFLQHVTGGCHSFLRPQCASDKWRRIGRIILIWENWSTWKKKKTCPSASLSTTNPTETGLGLNLGLHSGTSVTNRKQKNFVQKCKMSHSECQHNTEMNSEHTL